MAASRDKVMVEKGTSTKETATGCRNCFYPRAKKRQLLYGVSAPDRLRFLCDDPLPALQLLLKP